ncbi:MAG TPA: colicin D domain-containing protein [Pseudonocardiaceae bacterium]|nr:colicin D domain-containing protein [Pseudonocardiaceae bacterium]
MTEAMDQVIRTLADLALQAGFSFVFGLASLFSGDEEGVPVAISKLGNAIGVAKIAAAVDTAVVAVAGTALVSLGFGIDAINGAMTAAINATPNPNLDPTTPESATSDTQAEQAAEKIGDEAAPRDIPNLKYSTKQLQKKFKHAADFGVDGSWSSDASAQFEGALQRFAQDSTNTLKSGTYHGEPATLIYNSTSGLCEVLRSDGSFWTAFRMGEEQLKNVIGRGSLGGG